MKPFTEEQLNELRKQFADLKTIPFESGLKLIKQMNRIPRELMPQLAAAKINFVSKLAANRIVIDAERKDRAA